MTLPRDAAAEARDPLADCGAHGCIFATSSGGMRTNGGCQHLNGSTPEVRSLLRAAAASLVVQRRELEAARAVVEAARRWFPPKGSPLHRALAAYDKAVQP